MVEIIDGIPVMHFRPNPNRGLKNLVSERTLPLHPQLVALGLPAFLQDMLGIAPEQHSPIQKLMGRFISMINRVQQGIDAMRFGRGSDNDSQSPGL